MSEKSFYIVPMKNNYIEKLIANSKEEALTKFAETMDTNMSAYFDAVEKEPVSYPHKYKYPEGKFELAMTIIMVNLMDERASDYYQVDALKGLDLEHMEEIGELQHTYEELKKANKHVALKTRKHFYKILHDITGFRFDKPDKKIRILLVRKEELTQATRKLSKRNISYSIDCDESIVITKKNCKRAFKTLIKADIDYGIRM